MPPSDRHSLEARRDRIASALEFQKGRADLGSSSGAMTKGESARVQLALEGDSESLILWDRIEKGTEFVSTTAIRVVPKVAPKPGVQMKAALMQSRVFVPGCRFRVLSKARSTSSTWWRVEVLGETGAPIFRGFVIQQAIRGKLAA